MSAFDRSASHPITEAEVEIAAAAARENFYRVADSWGSASEGEKDDWRLAIRASFLSLGFPVGGIDG
jgi:hypothetical protein